MESRPKGWLAVGLWLAVASASAAEGQESMIPDTSLMKAVFHLLGCDGASAGTGFALEHDGEVYLVTAAHVVPGSLCRGLHERPYVHLEFEDGRVGLPVRQLVLDDALDVAVFKARNIGDSDDALGTVADHHSRQWFETVRALEPGPVRVGQDVLFLGYPFGGSMVQLRSDHPADDGYPLPFIKKGIVSASVQHELWVDNTSQFGFSGGPLVVRSGSGWKVIGVMTRTTAGDGRVGLSMATRIGFVTESIDQQRETSPSGAPHRE